jgi:hypothetical protein
VVAEMLVLLVVITPVLLELQIEAVVVVVLRLQLAL